MKKKKKKKEKKKENSDQCAVRLAATIPLCPWTENFNRNLYRTEQKCLDSCENVGKKCTFLFVAVNSGVYFKAA